MENGHKRWFSTLVLHRRRGGGITPSVIACGDATFPTGTAFGGGGKVSGIAQRHPLGGAGAQRLRGFLPKLPQSRYARQPPLRWGLWHGGKASGSSAKLAGAPEAPSQRELEKPIGFD